MCLLWEQSDNTNLVEIIFCCYRFAFLLTVVKSQFVHHKEFSEIIQNVNKSFLFILFFTSVFRATLRCTSLNFLFSFGITLNKMEYILRGKIQFYLINPIPTRCLKPWLPRSLRRGKGVNFDPPPSLKDRDWSIYPKFYSF